VDWQAHCGRALDLLLAEVCLRLWAAPRPRVAPPTERRPPPLITTFVAALRPVALRAAGSRAIPPGIERPPDEGPPPRLTVPPVFRGAIPRPG
jgi:hypothetical protein